MIHLMPLSLPIFHDSSTQHLWVIPLTLKSRTKRQEQVSMGCQDRWCRSIGDRLGASPYPRIDLLSGGSSFSLACLCSPATLWKKNLDKHTVKVPQFEAEGDKGRCLCHLENTDVLGCNTELYPGDFQDQGTRLLYTKSHLRLWHADWSEPAARPLQLLTLLFAPLSLGAKMTSGWNSRVSKLSSIKASSFLVSLLYLQWSLKLGL